MPTTKIRVNGVWIKRDEFVSGRNFKTPTVTPMGDTRPGF